jgi:hypothetical protein
VSTPIAASQAVRHGRGWCPPIAQTSADAGTTWTGSYATTRSGKARTMAAVRFETSSLA